MSRFGLSVTLGGGEVKLFDLVHAYSAFANGGEKVEPVSILKVTKNGRTLYEAKQAQKQRVLSEEVAFLINHVLADNNARLLTFGSNSFLNMAGKSIAVKTGTTNDKRDNWTVGWSTKAVVGVWVGNFSGEPMWNVSGVTGAATVWSEMMDYLERDTGKSERPPMPDDVISKIVSGGSNEYFIRGTDSTFDAGLEVASSGTRPRITYPANDTVFAIDPDIPVNNQRIPIQVSSTKNDFLITIDGDRLSSNELSNFWTLTPGRHIISLVGANGATWDRVVVVVKGLNSNRA